MESSKVNSLKGVVMAKLTGILFVLTIMMFAFIGCTTFNDVSEATEEFPKVGQVINVIQIKEYESQDAHEHIIYWEQTDVEFPEVKYMKTVGFCFPGLENGNERDVFLVKEDKVSALRFQKLESRD